MSENSEKVFRRTSASVLRDKIIVFSWITTLFTSLCSMICLSKGFSATILVSLLSSPNSKATACSSWYKLNKKKNMSTSLFQILFLFLNYRICNEVQIISTSKNRQKMQRNIHRETPCSQLGFLQSYSSSVKADFIKNCHAEFSINHLWIISVKYAPYTTTIVLLSPPTHLLKSFYLL